MVVHGGLRRAELDALGLDPASVVDLSANLNPLGPDPRVLAAAAHADVTRYPEPDAASLRDRIAERTGLASSEVLVTPGATAAVHLVARALLATGDACWLFPPTFGEYEAAARLAGSHVVECSFSDLSGGQRPAPRLVMLCNPNNPTGEYLERDAVEALVGAARCPLLLDVAYDSFVEEAWDADDLVRQGAEVLIAHSITKLHAIPGVRVGYLTGPASLVGRVAALQPSWAVGATALAAGLAALEVDAEQRRAASAVAATRRRLCARLEQARLEVREGRANFFLVNVGAAEGGTPGFRRRLLRRGFAVRDCASFGLPDWVRVAVPEEAAAERLLPAFLAAFAERG